jgi:hypothetical protein
MGMLGDVGGCWGKLVGCGGKKSNPGNQRLKFGTMRVVWEGGWGTNRSQDISPKLTSYSPILNVFDNLAIKKRQEKIFFLFVSFFLLGEVKIMTSICVLLQKNQSCWIHPNLLFNNHD